MPPIRVLVLDDSTICRVRLKEILEAEGDIRVVGEASNGDGVLELIRKTSPRMLLVDLQMPGTGGQETIERVMANHPLPILVVSGQPEGVRKSAVFESIRRGALDLAEKPGPLDRAAAARLRAMVRQLSTVPVVRHVAGTFKKPGAAVPNAAPAAPRAAPLSPRGVSPRGPAAVPRGARIQPLMPAALPRAVAPPNDVAARGSPSSIVGIAASAGGPLALVSLLSELPRDFPAAIAVVQHLPVGFAQAFLEFLQGRQGLPVALVHARTAIRPGTIYLACDDRHLVATDTQHLGPSSAPAVQGHRPSADALLQSLAATFGARAAGVVLSGIGDDGVAGLRALRDRGGLTLAQDQSSSGVYGMPRAAFETGAALSAFDPPGLARALRDWAAPADDARGWRDDG